MTAGAGAALPGAADAPDMTRGGAAGRSSLDGGASRRYTGIMNLTAVSTREAIKSRNDTPSDKAAAIFQRIIALQEAREDRAGRMDAYQRLLKYKGTLNRDIDYKRELAEARDKKFDRPL